MNFKECLLLIFMQQSPQNQMRKKRRKNLEHVLFTRSSNYDVRGNLFKKAFYLYHFNLFFLPLTTTNA